MMSKLAMVTIYVIQHRRAHWKKKQKALCINLHCPLFRRKGMRKTKWASMAMATMATMAMMLSMTLLNWKDHWLSGNIVDYLQFSTDAGETKFANLTRANLQKLNHFRARTSLVLTLTLNIVKVIPDPMAMIFPLQSRYPLPQKAALADWKKVIKFGWWWWLLPVWCGQEQLKSLSSPKWYSKIRIRMIQNNSLSSQTKFSQNQKKIQ